MSDTQRLDPRRSGRHGLHEEGALHVGRWRIDPATRTATDGSVVRRLSPRAVHVLHALVEARGDVVARADLLDAAWPDIHVGDDSLTQAVAELRRAFGDRRGANRIIETIQKSGYRLIAPVLIDVGAERAPVEAEPDAFDVDAYLLCLEARRAMARSGKDAVALSEALAREAVQRAPRFALARAEYAIALVYRGLYRECAGGGLADAAEHAETAVRLRPDLAIAHAAKGFALGALGARDAALDAFARAFARDAGDGDAHYLCARTLFASRDHLAAAIMGERAAALSPDDFQALFLAARAAAAVDPSRARRVVLTCRARLESRLSVDPTEPRALNALGPALALSGEAAAARSAIEADGGAGSALEFYNVVAETAIEEIDRALDALETVVENGWRHGSWLRAEPILARLADEPRFRRVERAIAAD